MFCEKCNIEYDDDSLMCKKCGHKLIEFTHIIDPDELDDLSVFNENDESEESTKVTVDNVVNSTELTVDDVVNSTEPSLLITVLGEDEADYLVDLLEVNSIPALKKQCEKDIDVSKEDDNCAFDILVPHELYPEALELVTDETDNEIGEEDMSDEDLDKLLEDLADEFDDVQI